LGYGGGTPGRARPARQPSPTGRGGSREISPQRDLPPPSARPPRAR